MQKLLQKAEKQSIINLTETAKKRRILRRSKMNIKDRMILDEYKKEKPNFIKLEQVVDKMLRDTVSESGVMVAGVEHRVKGEKSLEGKLYKNGEWYQKLDDLTDLLGARIICYFGDDVDKVGKLIEKMFEIDWANSSDKRALIKADTFGYLSLHYICSLPKDKGYPDEICGKRFEIQIRTILQHAWAAINHDLGYKSEFGVPRAVTREFARLAGLLEIADDEFIRARDHINSYANETREKIINDNAGDVLIDMISLREYMLRNKKMRAFIESLAAIEGSEISDIDPESYIAQLKWLKIETIGQLQEMLEKNKALALKLAEKVLKGSELDILSSNVGLRFLCRAQLLTGGYTEAQSAEFIALSVSKPERAERQAKRLFNMYDEIKSEL